MRLQSAFVALSLIGCACGPASYPVPPQHDPVSAPDPLTAKEYFRVTDPDADTYIVGGVRELEGGAFRWTFARPEFRFQLADIQDRKFRLEFAVHPITLRDVGPLEITVEVNGRFLDYAVFSKAGDATFERPVPQTWLIADGDNRVTVRVHNPWSDRSQGVDLGFVLRAAGFFE